MPFLTIMVTVSVFILGAIAVVTNARPSFTTDGSSTHPLFFQSSPESAAIAGVASSSGPSNGRVKKSAYEPDGYAARYGTRRHQREEPQQGSIRWQPIVKPESLKLGEEAAKRNANPKDDDSVVVGPSSTGPAAGVPGQDDDDDGILDEDDDEELSMHRRDEDTKKPYPTDTKGHAKSYDTSKSSQRQQYGTIQHYGHRTQISPVFSSHPHSSSYPSQSHHRPEQTSATGRVIWQPAAFPVANHHQYGIPSSSNNDLSSAAWQRYLEESQKRRIDAIKQQILTSLGMKTPPVGIGSKMYSPEQRDKMRQEFAKANPSTQVGPAQEDQPCEAFVEKTQSFFPQCEPPKKFSEDFWSKPNSFNIYFKVSPSTPRDDVRPDVLQALLHIYKLAVPDEALLSGKSSLAAQQYADGTLEERQVKVTVLLYLGKIRKGKVRTRPLVHRWVSASKASWLTFPIESKIVTRWMETRKSRNFGLTVTVQRRDGEFLDPGRVFSRKDCSNKNLKETPLPGILERVAVTDVKNQVRVATRKYPTLDVKYVEIPVSASSTHQPETSTTSMTTTTTATTVTTPVPAPENLLAFRKPLPRRKQTGRGSASSSGTPSGGDSDDKSKPKNQRGKNRSGDNKPAKKHGKGRKASSSDDEFTAAGTERGLKVAENRHTLKSSKAKQTGEHTGRAKAGRKNKKASRGKKRKEEHTSSATNEGDTLGVTSVGGGDPSFTDSVPSATVTSSSFLDDNEDISTLSLMDDPNVPVDDVPSLKSKTLNYEPVRTTTVKPPTQLRTTLDLARRINHNKRRTYEQLDSDVTTLSSILAPTADSQELRIMEETAAELPATLEGEASTTTTSDRGWHPSITKQHDHFVKQGWTSSEERTHRRRIGRTSAHVAKYGSDVASSSADNGLSFDDDEPNYSSDEPAIDTPTYDSTSPYHGHKCRLQSPKGSAGEHSPKRNPRHKVRHQRSRKKLERLSKGDESSEESTDPSDLFTTTEPSKSGRSEKQLSGVRLSTTAHATAEEY